MREEAFAKYTRPLDSQLVHERRPSRALLATAGGIAAAIGVTVVVALLFLNGFPKPKSDPSELAVSISTPASATPAQVTSEDSASAASRIQAVSNDARKRKPETCCFRTLPPLERLKNGPKNPKLCLKNSFSGSKGNSIKNRTREPAISESRLLTEAAYNSKINREGTQTSRPYLPYEQTFVRAAGNHGKHEQYQGLHDCGLQSVHDSRRRPLEGNEWI